jgi:tetratricopeptide (TPR) repeat protein
MNMKSLVFLVLTFAVLSAQGAAPEQTRQRLRALALLPQLSFSVRITTSELEHPELFLGADELARRIAGLQKETAQNAMDAAAWFRLGCCLQAAKRIDDSAAASAKAVKLFRDQAEGRPRDGALQASFALALEQNGDVQEAEHVLRSATSAVPKDWNCWVGLGQLLDHKEATAICGGRKKPVDGKSLEEQLRALLPTRPTPELLAEARECHTEAEQCFDQAVSLAPTEPEVYEARALHRYAHALLDGLLLKFLKGQEQLDLKDIETVVPSPEFCDDFAHASRLSPTNATLIGCWVWAEISSAMISGGGTKLIDRLPESRRKNVLEAMRLLEDLSENPASRTAAAALEALGIVRLITALDPAAAKTDFQRAVALDPSRAQAWQGLVATTIESDPNELVEVCERWVKSADTARNHVALAKACDRANLPDKALEYARLAVQRDPADPLPQLCLGALLLRRSGDAQAAAEMRQHFAAALAAINVMEKGDELRQLGVTYGLNMAIILALDGNLELARKTLRDLAGMGPVDQKIKERIKDIESVLGE